MERVNLAQLNSALTAADASLQKSLSGEDLSTLLAEMDALTRRYPSQDQEESIEAYQQDLEALAVKHSISTVVSALRELRLKPGQKFFPRPDEVAEEIERQRDRARVPGADETRRRAAEWDEYKQHLLTDPREIAFRREKFGYDPWTEQAPVSGGAA